MFRHPRRLFGPVAVVAAIAIAFPLGVLATIVFSDVPPSHPFYADIQAVANAGVTTGCGGGKYCPEDFVTRGQMAAFMNRLGALAPGKTPVVNADKLDGLDSTSFLPNGSPPVGTTIRGSYAVGTADAYAWEGISFGVMLPSAPQAEWLAAADSRTVECAGTSTDPTAAQGWLCIYEAATGFGNIGNRQVLAPSHNGSAGTGDRWGAALALYRGAAAADFWSYGSWAVTVGTASASTGKTSGTQKTPKVP